MQSGETKVGMHTLGLALIEDYDNTSPIHIERLGNKVKRELCEELEGRLRSRCGGLLEVKGALKPRRDGEEFCLCGQHDSTPHNEYHIDPTMVFHHDGYIDSTVVFMHRTVFEFLSEEHVWELDCLRAPDNGLNLYAALILYCLYLALQVSGGDEKRQGIWSCLAEGLRWAHTSDNQALGFKVFFQNLQPLLDYLTEAELSFPPVEWESIIRQHLLKACTMCARFPTTSN